VIRASKTAATGATQPLNLVPVDFVHTRGASGKKPGQALAFSYQRVSSAKQAADERTGLDRQADQFLPFCQRHGLLPCTDPLIDAGISAYRGSNRRQGALGQFLDAARDGLIPPGSVLVVEDLDRFSREAPADALRLLLNDVFSQGIAIGVARFDSVISEDEFNRQAGAAIQLQMAIQMAHDYSRKLGERVSVAAERGRARARQGETVDPHHRPQWLDYDASSGTFTVNDRWGTYRRIVDLGLDGYGRTRTAQIVNAEGHRNSKGGDWSSGSVAKVWSDSRMIGERVYGHRKHAETEILPGFFPAVLSVEDWERLQQRTAQRRAERGRAGRGDLRRNILQGVVTCPCGGRLSMEVRQRNGRSNAYLVCASKNRGTCSARNIRYDERALLLAFMANKWARFFDRPADNKRRRELDRQVREAEALLAKQRQQQEKADGNISELLLGGSLTADTAALLGKVAKDAKSHADATEASLASLRDQFRQASIRPDGVAMQKAMIERVEAFMATGLSDPAERVKFNSWLTTLGVTVSLYRDSQGRVEMDFTLAEAKAWGMDEASLAALQEDLRRRVG
jgi:hypothetical protein